MHGNKTLAVRAGVAVGMLPLASAAAVHYHATQEKHAAGDGLATRAAHMARRLIACLFDDESLRLYERERASLETPR